jgi:hypothetical protein
MFKLITPVRGPSCRSSSLDKSRFGSGFGLFKRPVGIQNVFDALKSALYQNMHLIYFRIVKITNCIRMNVPEPFAVRFLPSVTSVRCLATCKINQKRCISYNGCIHCIAFM